MSDSAPLALLIALRNAADVLRAPSTRGARAVAPVARELLRAQQRFNTGLAEVLLDWVAVNGERDAIGYVRGQLGVADRVQPLERKGFAQRVLSVVGRRAPAPATRLALEARHPTHRTGLSGRTVQVLKRAALASARPVVARLLAAQEAFNVEVLALLDARLGGRAVETSGLERARAAVDAILAAPVMEAWLGPQRRFNALAVQALALELPRSHAQAYARWLQAGEPCARPPAKAPDVPVPWVLAPRGPLTEVCRASLAAQQHPWALSPAEGSLTLLLEGTEVFAPGAFARWEAQRRQHPFASLWFGDHDELDAAGHRAHPFFKPALGPFLFAETDSVGSVALFRTDALASLGGPKVARAELLWRALEQKLHAAHLDGVAWHDAGGAEERERRDTEHALATRRHARRRGARFLRTGLPRLRFPVPPQVVVSLVIPLRDRIELLEQLLASLESAPPGLPIELILVDNGSKEPRALKVLDGLARSATATVLHHDAPFNWSALNNLGATAASGQVLGFLNNDLEATQPGWLELLAGYALLPEVGVVGSTLAYPDGALQHAGVVVGMKGLAGHVHRRSQPPHLRTALGQPTWTREVSAVTGACLLLRRELYDALDGFDERIAISGADVELCLRAGKRGLATVCVAGTGLVHHESISRQGLAIPARDLKLEREAYRELLDGGDPYFNSSLSTASTAAVPWLDGEHARDRSRSSS